jgi:ferredoxin
MRQLPIDARGYPVPWFVQYVKGEPEFRAMDIRKFRKAIEERLCWTCGRPLYAEEVFVIGPMCAVNRISSEPPSHRECAEYAARNCPFLSKPHMHRRKDGGISEIIKPSPGVMIERNPGVTLLWYTRRHLLLNIRNRPGAVDGVLFQIARPFKTEWYCRGRPATREEILESIESGLPILREAAEKHDGPEGLAYLETQITQAYKLLPRS